MRLKGLDGIRGLCALFLLWGHMAQKVFVEWSIISLPLPECVAYVFFLISGVLAGFRIDTISSAKSYYVKKAKRILPLYYFYILFVLFVFSFLGRSSEVFNSRIFYYLFLLPSIPFVKTQGIVPLVHLWFIGSLVIFYLVTPLFAKFKEDKRQSIALIIALIWFVIKLLAKVLGGGFIYRLVGCTCFDIFSLGVWGGLIIKGGLSIPKPLNALLNILVWGIFLLSGLYGDYIPAPIRTEFVAMILLIIIVTEQSKKTVSLLDNKLALFIGGISYEIYVVHIIIIILLSVFYTWLNIYLPDWCIYLCSTLIVFIIAYLIKKAVSLMFPSKKIEIVA